MVAGMPAIVTDRLTKRYEQRVAVDALSIEIPDGVIAGFVGPNGAGKTTSMRMLLGLIRPTAGTGEVLGAPFGDPKALERVGALIESPAFHPAMSARRNLRVLATLGALPTSRIDEVLEIVELADRADEAVHTFSLGMRQRLAFAAALLPRPRLLLLDEPTNGLDPPGIHEMRTFLRQTAAAGCTILVSSHLLAELEQVCDWLVVLERGQLVFQGSMETLRRQQTTTVVGRPEHADDADALVKVLADAGLDAVSSDGTVRVADSGEPGAQLNRLAFEAGIVLTELREQTQDLEEAFFRMMEDRR
jgi:ABC-2 type transport system ATP-binding protein